MLSVHLSLCAMQNVEKPCTIEYGYRIINGGIEILMHAHDLKDKLTKHSFAMVIPQEVSVLHNFIHKLLAP